jgi:hypothetical protein
MRHAAKALTATLATLAFWAAPAQAVTAVTQSATNVTDTSATLRGQVNSGLLDVGSTVYFEYGRTKAYGKQTPTWAFSGPTVVKVKFLGLSPSTAYHYRIVATGLLSTVRGVDQAFTTLDPPPPPPDPNSGSGTPPPSDSGSGSTPPDNSGPGPTPPDSSDGTTPDPSDDGTPDPEPGPPASGGAAAEQLPIVVQPDNSDKPILGSTIGAAPQSGSVEVKTPGAENFTPLPDGGSIPVGSTVDARNGAVNVVTAVGDAGAVQTATFRGAIFQVQQSPKGGGLTDIYLRGGDFSACHARSPLPNTTHSLAKKKRRHAIRRLWANDHHGRFRTHGRGAIATVRGTTWVVADLCDGTRTSVLAGAVSVRDKRRHKTVLVHAGHSYFARTHR